ncbi:conjugal transfer protein [Streptomyces triculaminicus]|uniref:conjugal transfer protein n=1 Tax=Streptomyces triculaminicus TaxID=2816232 RepID=UPI0037D40B38
MSWWRKMPNLPDEKEGGDELAGTLTGSSRRPNVEKAKPEAVAAQMNDAEANSQAWMEEDEPSGLVFARRAGRVLVWAVIALAVFSGVRAWFFPAQWRPPAKNPGSQVREVKTDQVPIEAAQQVAARFARSYLSWSEKAPDVRERDMAMDLPRGADPKLGWDGRGNQQVAQTIPGPVTQTGGRQARVLVSARVSVTSDQGKKQQTLVSWRGLDVPVAFSGGRVVVTGQPALVGIPRAVDYRPSALPETDSAMTEATRQVVMDFLVAWAAGNESQAAAPGAEVAPLGGQMQLSALESWAVDVGSGERRTGTATVRWKFADSQVQQTYRITVTEVSAAASKRWQVASLTARAG